MQTSFRLPVFSASPQRVSPPAGDTQRDGGRLTPASYTVLDTLIKNEITLVMQHYKNRQNVVRNSLERNAKKYAIPLDPQDNSLRNQVETVYRGILNKWGKRLEEMTPEKADITLFIEKDMPQLIQVKSGLLNNAKTIPDSITFYPLFQEVIGSKQHYWLETFFDKLDAISQLIHINQLKFGGLIRRLDYIPTPQGDLTAKMIQDLLDEGDTPEEIAFKFSINKELVQKFRLEKMNVRQYAQNKESAKLDALLLTLGKIKKIGQNKEILHISMTPEELSEYLKENYDIQRRASSLNTILKRLGMATPYVLECLENTNLLLEGLASKGYNTGTIKEKMNAFLDDHNARTWTCPKIAQALGCSTKTIVSMQTQNKILPPKIKTAFKEARRAYIEELKTGPEGLEATLKRWNAQTLFQDAILRERLGFESIQEADYWLKNKKNQIKKANKQAQKAHQSSALKQSTEP
ncbi:MAG: hypothetical protein HEQ32_06235 [Vampirovibrio sp.]